MVVCDEDAHDLSVTRAAGRAVVAVTYHGLVSAARERTVQSSIRVLVAILVLMYSGGWVLNAASQHILAVDARGAYLPLAHRIVNGISPYPSGNLPPLGFFLFVPFTPVPHPEILLTLIAIALVPTLLLALDVRDWRCYAAAFAWAPVLSAIQTVNLTLPLAVAAAFAWRWRDTAARAAAAAGLSIAAKLITAPLLVWLLATRRVRAAVLSVGVAVGVTLVLGTVIQFLEGSHATDFVRKQGRLAERPDTPSYSPLDFAPAHGYSSALGGLVVALVLALLVALCVKFARDGDDQRSFAAAATAIVVFNPNIWLHSLTFLLLPLGVLRPRFNWLWLLPVALIPIGVKNTSTADFVFFWVVAVVIAGWLLIRPTSTRAGAVGSDEAASSGTVSRRAARTAREPT